MTQGASGYRRRMMTEADIFPAAPGGPADALARAAAALNEVERLERVRYDLSAEEWQIVLHGLSKVLAAADRVCASLSARIPDATKRAAWRAGEPATVPIGDELERTADALQEVAVRLAEVAELTRSAGDRLAHIRFDRPAH